MIGELVKPLDTLINRTFDGVGGFLKPWQMKRIAVADIEIAQLKAQAGLKSDGTLRDVEELFVYDAIKKQANLHNIKIEAFKHLGSSDVLNNFRDEFINFFLEKSQNISDEMLQQLWGKVLAGEIKNKGSFSKRTIEFINTLNVDEANDIYHLFNGLGIVDESPELLVILPQSLLINSRVYSTDKFSNHLEDLGIFNSFKPRKKNIFTSDNPTTNHYPDVVFSLDKKIALSATIELPVNNTHAKPFIITNTPLTSLGRELARIAKPKPDRVVLKKIIKELEKNNDHCKVRPRRYKRNEA